VKDERAPEAARRILFQALLSIQRHTTSSLEKLLGPIHIDLGHGGHVSFEDLSRQPGGAELTPEWHECIRRLANWADEAEWKNASVFGQPLIQKLRQLSEARFNPTWTELPKRMDSEESWRIYGELFWKTPRNPCPATHRGSVLLCLRVPDGTGNWLPIHDLWLEDDFRIDCFAGLFKSWPLRGADPARKRITEFLKQWGIFDEWESTKQKLLTQSLSGKLVESLTANENRESFALVFDDGFQVSRRRLGLSWKAIVDSAERTAIKRFVLAKQTEQKLSGATVLSRVISEPVRAALCLSSGRILAPPWPRIRHFSKFLLRAYRVNFASNTSILNNSSSRMLSSVGN
jgi:hypothetical protein